MTFESTALLARDFRWPGDDVTDAGAVKICLKTCVTNEKNMRRSNEQKDHMSLTCLEKKRTMEEGLLRIIRVVRNVQK